MRLRSSVPALRAPDDRAATDPAETDLSPVRCRRRGGNRRSNAPPFCCASARTPSTASVGQSPSGRSGWQAIDRTRGPPPGSHGPTPPRPPTETETTAAGPFHTSEPWPRCAQPQAGHRGTTRPPPPPPTDCGELVQANDDRAVFRALREVLPVIDPRSL